MIMRKEINVLVAGANGTTGDFQLVRTGSK